MSIFSPGSLQGTGTVAYNAYQQTSTALAGNPQLVHFLDVRTGACIFQFDAVINETHQSENQITTFPVETGATVTDHIIVSPVELTIQGIVTDTQTSTPKALLTEVIATGVTAVAPPLVIAALGTAYPYASASSTLGALTSQSADQGTPSPSQAAFTKLFRIQNGDPGATPPVPPSLVHVHTRLNVYTNMAIKSLSVPRDRTVSNAIVVQITLTQLALVRPQLATISALANPAVAAKKIDEGTKLNNDATKAFNAQRAQGRTDGKPVQEFLDKH